MKKIHPKEYGEFPKPKEKAECPICKEKIDKTYLKKHVRTIHEGKRDKIHKCEHCGKEYVEKNNMIFISTPFSRAAVDRLVAFDVPAVSYIMYSVTPVQSLGG